MIKKCPTCNRTYADETISFCLADGELLSAPFDPKSTALSREDEPVTEILPAPVPPTQAAIPAERITTITAAMPRLPRPTRGDAAPTQANHKWIVIGAALLLLVIGGGLVGYRMLSTRQSEATARLPTTGSPESTPIPQPGATQVSAQPSPTQVLAPPSPTAMPPPRPSPTEKPSPNIPTVVLPDPHVIGTGVGVGPGNGGGNTGDYKPGEPSGGPPYYDRVFQGKDVTQKARVLSKPEPEYTEEARQNQVTGTVVLQVVLTFDGQVTNIRPVTALPDGLTERAIEAARKLKFLPATKDGHAVSMYMQLEYNFNLY